MLYLDSILICTLFTQDGARALKEKKKKRSLHAVENKLVVYKQCQETSGVCLVSYN